MLPFIGPAVVASVAYMDPGNIATNIAAGAGLGYQLLWVVLLANVIAMLFQALSAKLGIATGMSLAEHCRLRLSRRTVLVLWLASEVAAMATDLAELLGGAIGLSLLFGMPLLPAVLATGVLVYLILWLAGGGFRALELGIGVLVAAIGLGYLAEILIAPPDWAAMLQGTVHPSLAGEGALMLAVGIVGATVMPHALYLHSSLVGQRVPVSTDAERAQVLRHSNREVLAALGLAGLVNMAMVAVAASVFHTGHPEVASIETAYRTLLPLLGVGAAGAFMVALLASGLSSSVVGTMAGQEIMGSFLERRLPLWTRRLLTMVPTVAVVAAGIDATRALVLSQVVLSLVLPAPMVALLALTSRRSVMGVFANSRTVIAVSIVAAIVVLGLNLLLLLDQLGIELVS